jgi:hypothetical protein
MFVARSAAANWSLKIGRSPGHCVPDRSDARRRPVGTRAASATNFAGADTSIDRVLFSPSALLRSVFISCHELPPLRQSSWVQKFTATFRSPFAFC